MTAADSESLDLLAGRLERGELTATALAELALERHERRGAELRAYKEFGGERVLTEARAVDAARASGMALGPLAGIPTSVKDLYGVAGYPTYAGTPRRLPREFEVEGFLVRELRRQLAVVTGKTHTVELAYGGLGTNPHWETPVNPWDGAVERVAGGSSCGAGVSLHEGSALIALGTDTACSIRTPSSFTGTVGLKTTRGRWATSGIFPLSPTLDTAGALTRTVRDAAFFFGAVDPDHGDPALLLRELDSASAEALTIGVVRSPLWELAPDVSAAVRSGLAALEAAGARLVDVDLPEFDQAYEWYAAGTLTASECRAFLELRLPEWIASIHPTVARRLERAQDVRAHELLVALQRRDQLMAAGRQACAHVDVLATPTVPLAAPAIAEVEDLDDYAAANAFTSRAANPVNVMGLCAISLPCGADSNGVPVGLQLIAGPDEDEPLLAAALCAERVLGTVGEQLGRAPRAG